MRKLILSPTYALIAINVAVSLYAFAEPGFFNALLFEVGAVRQGDYYRLITSGFLHGGVAHLAFNMLTLFFFGPALENKRFLGARDFLIVYFVSLLVGSLTAFAAHFNEPYYAAVGASGAVSGVLVGISLFAPFATILIFGVIPMPAILYTILFIAYSAFAAGRDGSNIGHEAHLGGAIAGLIATIWLRPGVVKTLIAQLNRKR